MIASFIRPERSEGSSHFAPVGVADGELGAYGYVEEEWFASGEADGHPYTTTVLVRRPSDPAQFSGVVLTETLHAIGSTPLWNYTSRYNLRNGHAWVGVCSQKSVLDALVKPSNPERYASTDIWSAAAPVQLSGDSPPSAGSAAPARPMQVTRETMEHTINALLERNALSTPILAQVGAGLRLGEGPFSGYDARWFLLGGHSQTGIMTADYVLRGHDTYRLPDGAPIYDGFFPGGNPSAHFAPRDVPVVHLVSEGDIADPSGGPGFVGRSYRRDDSDEAGDRYRLYEVAGIAHLGTRTQKGQARIEEIELRGLLGPVPPGASLSSLPHNELFRMGVHHLVEWVANGTVPPRAARIEVDPDGCFTKDEFGNVTGGVRCAQLDVPRLRYLSTPAVDEQGIPIFGIVGIELPLADGNLARLYEDHDDYVRRFNARVDELVREGWLLPDDAPEMRSEAEEAEVP